VSSLHCTTRRTRSAGAALAYGARLAYLASLEEDEAGDAEPETAAAEGTPAVEGTVAEARNSRSPSPSRPSPVSKTPPDTPESRAPVAAARETNDDECFTTRDRIPNGGPPRDDVTGTAASPHHSPLPFGAAYASSPLPSRRATAKRDANGEDARRGGERAAAAAPAASTRDARDDAASYASPGFVSRDGTRTEGERYSESDKTLVARYDAMQTDFERETRGFAMAEVDETKRWFHFEDPPGVGVWPLPYTQLGLPKDCTRLVVLSLVDAPAVAAAGAACAREMVKLLGPCGAACFTVPRNAYHVSVFFLSLPTDPVADPLSARADADASKLADARFPNKNETSAFNVSLASAPLRRIGGRFQPALEDVARAAETAARTAAFSTKNDEDFLKTPRVVTLTVDRVALVKSGALLLLFRDPNGDLARFRDELRTAFPSAPTKQPTIAHCTLLRAFPETSDALTSGSSGRALADAKALCARWTARVRGTRVRVDRAWLVREERFSSIDGARRAFKMGPEV
jgi:hypothetical protein